MPAILFHRIAGFFICPDLVFIEILFNLVMQIKSSADNSELNYCYRADGGKFSALDADKTSFFDISLIQF